MRPLREPFRLEDLVVRPSLLRGRRDAAVAQRLGVCEESALAVDILLV
jgi:hypothetical protein